MASPDLVIDYHKLDTKFLADHVQHTTFRSDASQGRRRVKVVKKWYRDRELGRGSFGTVFLERSEKGEYRAVKEIAKDKNSTIKIDYKRELTAMAILTKHDALFVQLFGWYESDNYVHIAMEYINHGDLRNYLEVERSESEAKAITRQLLEGLVVIHQEGFAHRDLKPENIFVVSTSPVWVKIGDFGLAKLARSGTAFRTQAFSIGYSAPEMGIKISGDSAEYTNAVDIWAVGCIAHEILTGVLPFRNFFELSSYCTCHELPRNSMLLKNISLKGIETVENMLVLHPERRIAAKEALDSEWLRLGDEGLEELETEDSAGAALPEVPAPSGAEVANGYSLQGSCKEGFHNRMAITADVKDQRTTEVLPLELKYRMQVGFSRKDPIGKEMSEMANHFDLLEPLGHIGGGPMRVGEQAAIDSVRLAYAAALIQTTKITQVLGAVIELPSVPHDEEYQFHKPSADLPQKRNEPIDLGDKGQTPTSASPAIENEQSRNEPIFIQAPSASPAAEKAIAAGYSDICSDPKPRTNIDAGVKRVLKLVLKRIQKSTDSPHKPMLSDKDAVYMLFTGLISMDIRDSAGNTPLHIAVKLLCSSPQYLIDLSPLHALVASGADINARNSEWKTPLVLAVSHGSAAVTGKLLELGANAEESEYEMLLHVAVQLGSDTICQLILQRGVNVNARNSLERTPLHSAVINMRLKVSGSLIAAGANVEAKDYLQKTALRYAVVVNSVPLTKLLLGHGASPDVADTWGVTPRQEAATKVGAREIVAMFDRMCVTP